MKEINMEILQQDLIDVNLKINIAKEMTRLSNIITETSVKWYREERVILWALGLILGLSHKWIDRLYSEKQGIYMLIDILKGVKSETPVSLDDLQ